MHLPSAAAAASALLWASATLCSCAAASDALELHVPGVSLSALSSARGSAEARSALETYGILAVTEVPGLAAARAAALDALGRCSLTTQRSHALAPRKFWLDDGTTRLTVAAAASRRLDVSDAQAAVSRGCDELRSAPGAAYRDALGDAALALAGAALPELQEAASDPSRQLDHAHAYMARETQQPRTAGLGSESHQHHHHEHHQQHEVAHDREQAQRQFSLDLHTDHGLVVAFTPAALMDGWGRFLPGPPAGQLWVRPPGASEPLAARFPCGTDNDCVVFMLGDALEAGPASNGRDVNGTARLHGLPHAMEMGNDAARVPGGARLWFGRMFLPVRVGEHVPDRGYGGMGCAGKEFRSLQHVASPLDCSSDEDYCWLNCRPKPRCGVGEKAYCLNPDGALWRQEDSHCEECKLTCAKEVQTGGNGFCNGLVTNMYMDGFNGVGNPDRSCLVFFFRDWRMDSWWTYLLGGIGAFVLGIITEWIVLYRRRFSQRYTAAGPRPPLRMRVAKASLYALAVFVGYLDMLLAMTYSAVIFCLVVLGLGVGHFVFNLGAPVQESADPCCVSDVLEDDEDGQQDSPGKNVSTPSSSASGESAAGSCCHNDASLADIPASGHANPTFSQEATVP